MFKYSNDIDFVYRVRENVEASMTERTLCVRARVTEFTFNRLINRIFEIKSKPFFFPSISLPQNPVLPTFVKIYLENSPNSTTAA